MPTNAMTRNSFSRGFTSNEQALAARIQLFLRRQAEDEVHQLRTAIRRYEAGFRLLPKSLRRDDEAASHMAKAMKLFDLATMTRDLDTIQGVLAAQLSSPDFSLLGRRLHYERTASLRRPMRFATSVVVAPQIDLAVVKATKLRRRFRRVVRNLLPRMRDELDAVLEEPDAVDALHALRMNSKKLRYTCELLPRTAKTRQLLKELEAWQDSLGEIRNLDTTTQYLAGLDDKAKVLPLLKATKRERGRLYRRFVMGSKDQNPLEKAGVLAET